jgi:hypothetical protein
VFCSSVEEIRYGVLILFDIYVPDCFGLRVNSSLEGKNLLVFATAGLKLHSTCFI